MGTLQCSFDTLSTRSPGSIRDLISIENFERKGQKIIKARYFFQWFEINTVHWIWGAKVTFQDSPPKPYQDQDEMRRPATEQQVGDTSYSSTDPLPIGNSDFNANNQSFSQEQHDEERLIMDHDQVFGHSIFPSQNVSLDDNQAMDLNAYGLSDDAWFTQNFINSDWLEIARGQGGFFF